MDFRTMVEKIQPYIAVAVLIMLAFLLFELSEYNRKQEEINKNCGWEEEDYYCYCEYSDVMNFKKNIEIKQEIENGNFELDR